MEGQKFLRDGVMMVRVPDGREFRVSDVMRFNNPQMDYDDATGEALAIPPPRAEDAFTPTTSEQDRFGDTAAYMAQPYMSDARDLMANAGRAPTYFTDPVLGSVERVGQYGKDVGLAGLNALMGGMYGGAGLLGDMVGGDPQQERRLARDLAGGIDVAGVGPEARMVGSINEAARPAVRQGLLDEVGRQAVDETGALLLPPSVRSLFDEGTLRNGMIDVPNDPNALDFFANRLAAAKESHGPIGKSVDVYDPEVYAGYRNAMTPTGDAGYAVKPDGEVASVVKNKNADFRGFGEAVMRRSEPQGGYWLNAFDTALPSIYGRGGFQPVSRLPFNEDVARGDWGDEATDAFMAANAKYSGGRPDLVFMARDPSVTAPVVQGQGGLLTDDWDLAVQALDDKLKQLGYRR